MSCLLVLPIPVVSCKIFSRIARPKAADQYRGVLKVVDFNVLHGEELRDFFRGSSANRIAATDNMAIECLKRDGTGNFRKSFDVLRDYSDRVVVLRSMSEAARQLPQPDGFGDSLIDAAKTSAFPKVCRRFALGDSGTLAMIEDEQAKAKAFVENFRRLLDQEMQTGFNEINTYAGTKWIKELRREKPIDGAQRDLVRWVATCAGLDAYKTTFPGKSLPHPSEIHFWFRFRFSVALTSLWLDWQRHAWQASIPVDKLLNDNLDIIYVAYGTCFDGVLSGDGKLQRISSIASSVVADSLSGRPLTGLPQP